MVNGGITKIINIDGMDVPMRASAAVVRDYRLKFGRDLIKDMMKLSKDVGKKKKESSNLDIESLEAFENLAYLMARKADPENVPSNPDDWFDRFGVFSIYEVLPQLVELWHLNTEQQAHSKKELARVSAK